ncbi:hypothetical protein B566_EDAN012146 [Ephemera danica]|nr:hypothetical protein B566_EDAN012146 [Ephemera danica]
MKMARRLSNRRNVKAFTTNLGWLLLFAFAISMTQAVNKDGSLETVTDDDLVNLVRSEKHVVVVFTQRDSAASEKLESVVTSLREDLVDTLGAWVVKAVGSHMTRLYNPLAPNQPCLVFFRHGVPLLYHGEIEEDLILHTLSDSPEPAVKELNDDNFEHLTQAATGATTGDWLVMFYGTSCVDCQRLQATWEAVAARLKARMNVARVNLQGAGAATARRFRVHKVPGFILFRQGKLYRYPLDKMDVASLATFATDCDDLTQAAADWLMERPWVWQGATALSLIGLVFLVVTRMFGRKQKEEKKQKQRKAK